MQEDGQHVTWNSLGSRLGYTSSRGRGEEELPPSSSTAAACSMTGAAPLPLRSCQKPQKGAGCRGEESLNATPSAQRSLF